jgi:hypothetical protein
MARKQLNDIINRLPHMVAARLHADDSAVLADIPDGVLTIDLLAGTACHGSGAELTVSAVARLTDWLDARLEKAQLARSDLIKAVLTVAIRTDRAPADRSRLIPFDLISTAEIATAERVYVSKQVSALLWYRRSDGVVMD